MSYALRWVGAGLIVVGIGIALGADERLMAGLLIVIGLCFIVGFRWTARW